MTNVKKLIKEITKKLVGFSVVGIITTLVSVILIYVVIHLFNGSLVWSYLIIYFLAIILSYILNMIFVFKNNIDLKGALIYFGIYLSGMAIGAIFLEYTKGIINVPDVWKAYMAIPITMTWNFGLSFFIFNSPKNE